MQTIKDRVENVQKIMDQHKQGMMTDEEAWERVAIEVSQWSLETGEEL